MADGPLPKGTYADAPGVKPLGYNPTLATMLIAAARKELGGTPIELKLEYPAIPEAQAVGPACSVERRSGWPGVKIEAVEVPESQLESELRAGRRFDLAYRVLRVRRAGPRGGPPALPRLRRAARDRRAWRRPRARGSSSCCSSSNAPPSSPRPGAWPIQIDRESRDELPVLPLWQVVDHYAWRTRLKGPGRNRGPALPGASNRGRSQPWIARDAWTIK